MDLNPFDDIAGLVEDAVAEAAGGALDQVVAYLFALVAGAISAVTDSLIEAMDTTVGIDLDADLVALNGLRSMVLAMSLTLVLAFLFISVMKSLAAGEPGNIMRALFVDVPTAMLFTTAFVAFTDKLLEVVDATSAVAVGDVGDSLGQIAGALVVGNSVTTAATDPGPALLAMFFGLVYVFAAVVVWAELLIRSALIFIIIVLAPLGFATRANTATREISRRTTEVLIALVMCKFAIAIAFGVGAALIDAGVQTPASAGDGDLNAMFVGMTVVVLAALMPWIILKLIPVMEAATAMQGAERSPLQAAGAVAGVGLAAVTAGRLAGTGAGAGGGVGHADLAPPAPSLQDSGAPSGGGGSSGGGGLLAQAGAAIAGVGTGAGSGSSAGSVSNSTGRVSDAAAGVDGGRSVEVVDVGAPRPGVVAVTPPPSAQVAASPQASGPASGTGAPLGAPGTHPPGRADSGER